MNKLVISQLREKIEMALLPLITGDYVLLDLPYYTNIGDVLIWQGTEELLKHVRHKCIYKTSYDNYKKRHFKDDCVILMQGGGNFGDLWRIHQEFRLNIVEEYPTNRIVVLPQSVCYEDNKMFENDMSILRKHHKLTVFVRDMASYNMLKNELADVRLVPDMAFMLNVNCQRMKTASGGNLFLRRHDKEQKDINNIIAFLPTDCDEYDWPTMEEDFPIYRYKDKPSRLVDRICRRLIPDFHRKWTDFYEDRFIRSFCVKKGIDFLSQYDHIYTTRLHGGILAALLGKQVTLFDNSYGKISSLYETWMTGFQNVRLHNF